MTTTELKLAGLTSHINRAFLQKKKIILYIIINTSQLTLKNVRKNEIILKIGLEMIFSTTGLIKSYRHGE